MVALKFELMSDDDELFGNPDQVALMRRAGRLWTLLGDDPRYSFYGRMVSLSDPRDDAVERLGALATLQGAASCQYYPADRADRFCDDLNSVGFNAHRYEQCWGGADAIAAARRLLDEHALPADLAVVTVDAATPADLVADMAGLSISCGVMPVPGRTMRGLDRPGICLVATDPAGKAAATASA